MTDISQALDLYNVLINEFAGSPLIFLFLGFTFILILGAYMRMPNQIIMMIGFLFLLIMSAFFPYLLPFTVLLAGGFIGWNFYKFIRG